jgi:putative oxidoreductase
MTAIAISLNAHTAVRILCGLFLLPHTYAKLTNVSRAAQLFGRVGFRPPRFFVVFTAFLELVAAASLISGFHPEIGGVVAAIVLVGASYAIARDNGLMWRWQHPGIEYMLFWALTCLFTAFLP